MIYREWTEMERKDVKTEAYSPDDCWNIGEDVAGAGAAKLLPFPAAEIGIIRLVRVSNETVKTLNLMIKIFFTYNSAC